ncbi:hypothetical protein FQR65_LT13029 [Abscondita terminalis]|nr:hypothetical protein FQR65_LT13029 [Abscondita terminalis]
MVVVNTLLIVGTTLIVFGSTICWCNPLQDKTLELVVTVFRHGDRTNDKATTYPKDPYINQTYFPYGYGELTNKGKMRLYKLGSTFRNMYNQFLGRLYLPGLISPLSTDYSRTKNSLQLFLAGLFPPDRTLLEWNNAINWNPIAFNYVSFQNNRELSFPSFYCPRFVLLLEEYKQSPEYLYLENQYNQLYGYVSQNTGLNVTSLFSLFGLYFGLTTEKEFGLKLPEWTKTVYPEYLEKAAADNYRTFTATPQLNQLFGGFLLKKTIKDMVRKINGEPNQPKMYIYSAHEISVVSILGALNLYYPHVPNYGASVILELHNINQKRYIKVLYNKNKFDKFFYLKIPGCNVICPFEDFLTLVAKNIPADGDPCLL